MYLANIGTVDTDCPEHKRKMCVRISVQPKLKRAKKKDLKKCTKKQRWNTKYSIIGLDCAASTARNNINEWNGNQEMRFARLKQQLQQMLRDKRFVGKKILKNFCESITLCHSKIMQKNIEMKNWAVN